MMEDTNDQASDPAQAFDCEIAATFDPISPEYTK